MKDEKTLLQRYALMISFMLPEGMLDYFELVNMREEEKKESNNELDVLFRNELHIYLDERDNRSVDELGLKPKGFTDETIFKDYPVRDRKVVLHVRRRRYVDADGRNIILCNYPLKAPGTEISVEFGAFFKDNPR